MYEGKKIVRQKIQNICKYVCASVCVIVCARGEDIHHAASAKCKRFRLGSYKSGHVSRRSEQAAHGIAPSKLIDVCLETRAVIGDICAHRLQ